jgi:hypothetical protein
MAFALPYCKCKLMLAPLIEPPRSFAHEMNDEFVSDFRSHLPTFTVRFDTASILIVTFTIPYVSLLDRYKKRVLCVFPD